MQTLTTIGLVILGIIIVIGIIRVSFSPWKGFTNFLIEVMLLDCLGDMFNWVVESLDDIWDND